MRIEWFIKEHLTAIGQEGELRSSLIPIANTAISPGHLRYVSPSFLIYYNTGKIVVDLPVTVDDSTSVLRVEASYIEDPTPAVLNACYGAMSVFLKALFLLSIETGAVFEQECNLVRSEMEGVLLHFRPGLSRGGDWINHATYLLEGWTSTELFDTPFQLSYSIDNETGAIGFHSANQSCAMSDKAKYGWISSQFAPHQSYSLAENRCVAHLADLRLVFMAGSGRNVSAWDLAVGAVAVPILNMLVK